MATSEETDVPSTEEDVAPQAAEASPKANEWQGMEPWPSELEICVEYCTRSAFHARHDPEKYNYYFGMVEEAFLIRSPQTKIVGNPFTGRSRQWKAYGAMAQDVDLPRLGSFEVTVRSAQLEEKYASGEVTVFSKLETRHWPNPRILVIQVDRLLRGEELLKPLPPSPRRKRQQNETSISYWSKQNFSPQSTPRFQYEMPSPEKSSPRPSPKKVASGRKEPAVQQAAQPPTDSKGTEQTVAETSEVFEESQYDEEFEGDESGEGSSCVGTKVWMPGAAKEEKWEEDVPTKKKASPARKNLA